jgi:thioredoxin 1
MLSPIIESISEEYKDKVTVGKINVDKNLDIASEYSVRAIPLVLIIKNGQVVERITGANPKEIYTTALENALV